MFLGQSSENAKRTLSVRMITARHSVFGSLPTRKTIKNHRAGEDGIWCIDVARKSGNTKKSRKRKKQFGSQTVTQGVSPMKISKWNFFVLLSGLLCLLTACASSGPLAGKVLEEGTNKPIAGAIVVARWQGDAFGLVHSPTVCVHVDTATTDAEGRYRITASFKSTDPIGVRNIKPIISAYKTGYVRSEFLSTKDDVLFLRIGGGGREERLNAIRVAGVSCGNAGESRKNLLPLYRALYEEALPLVVTKGDKYFLSNLLNQIEEIELPYEEAQKRHIDRHNAISHEK
jgi:hypothetical protein